MLKAVPKGWFSYDFDVYEEVNPGAPIARADLSNWRENAKLEVGGTRYEATHRSGRKEFVLTREDGSTVLVAEKPSAWKERFSFEYDHVGYELRKESVWRKTFVLSRDGGGAVGSLQHGGMFKREWTAQLPEELPIEVRVFVMWLTFLMWNREDASAASSAASSGGA